MTDESEPLSQRYWNLAGYCRTQWRSWCPPADDEWWQERESEYIELAEQAKAEAEEPDLRFNVGTEPWTEPGA